MQNAWRCTSMQMWAALQLDHYVCLWGSLVQWGPRLELQDFLLKVDPGNGISCFVWKPLQSWSILQLVESLKQQADGFLWCLACRCTRAEWGAGTFNRQQRMQTRLECQVGYVPDASGNLQTAIRIAVLPMKWLAKWNQVHTDWIVKWTFKHLQIV